MNYNSSREISPLRRLERLSSPCLQTPHTAIHEMLQRPRMLHKEGRTHVGLPCAIPVDHSSLCTRKKSSSSAVHHRAARHHGGSPTFSARATGTAATAAESTVQTTAGTFLPCPTQAYPRAKQATSQHVRKHSVHLLHYPAHTPVGLTARTGASAASQGRPVGQRPHRSGGGWGSRPVRRSRPYVQFKHQP